ncbi:IS4 family transposase [Subsaximicrobium wynnwilliamsii]|uniref:IS4 family transposase n=1 Tax=Subsaximicrobium wynnwilliamsii TaxID=291179 RepID=A0A5C6ZB87_9FLAO|nr:IS4 family transposase [Subsaximicrobium wynnwilliamsii]TXD80404.1 IS4 family transposase [Subsaximicrobium wynnwilliamsii]TXD85976.1 IS4 family transposase [Subsaximicrobium wynnwilliamsii]
MFEKVRAEIFGNGLKTEFKVSKEDFTRNRKQRFPILLLFMLNFLKKSLSLEIENFTSLLKVGPNAKFTKSAFVQARKKVRPEVFDRLSQVLLNEFYTDNEPAIKLWKGFRLLAVDGTRITLPITAELKEIYGETKNQSSTVLVQARCSVIYDVLNKYVLDGALEPLKRGERDLALSHLGHCNSDDLMIYDRGYPSYDFIYQHINRDFDYLMRAKTSFSGLVKDFEESRKKSLVVSIYPGKNAKLSDKEYTKNSPIKVRLIRIDLGKGNVEILMTSLLDSNVHPTSQFKELYFKRWGVETFYDELKNKLRIEHFSGYSNQSILQDFKAALFVSNVQTLIVSELEEDLKESNRDKKYDYKVNTNISYGLLKDRVVTLFLDKKPTGIDIVEELKTLYKSHLVPIRTNRKSERNPDKYRSRIKPKITKNQKDGV